MFIAPKLAAALEVAAALAEPEADVAAAVFVTDAVLVEVELPEAAAVGEDDPEELLLLLLSSSSVSTLGTNRPPETVWGATPCLPLAALLY